MSFLLFLVGFLEKGMKSAKFGNFRGPMPLHRDPYVASYVHANAWHVHTAVWLRGRFGKPQVRCSLAVLHRGVATIHSV